MTLGLIGTSLGVVNLVRDIRYRQEKLTIEARPVVRVDTRELDENTIMAQALDSNFSQLDPVIRARPVQNIAATSPDAVERWLRNGIVPNLIGFEVTNLSAVPVFLRDIGLAKAESRGKYMGEAFSAILPLGDDGDPYSNIGVEPGNTFITYLVVDRRLLLALHSGVIFPYLETRSKRLRVWSDSVTLKSLAQNITVQSEASGGAS